MEKNMKTMEKVETILKLMNDAIFCKDSMIISGLPPKVITRMKDYFGGRDSGLEDVDDLVAYLSGQLRRRKTETPEEMILLEVCEKVLLFMLEKNKDVNFLRGLTIGDEADMKKLDVSDALDKIAKKVKNIRNDVPRTEVIKSLLGDYVIRVAYYGLMNIDYKLTTEKILGYEETITITA